MEFDSDSNYSPTSNVSAADENNKHDFVVVTRNEYIEHHSDSYVVESLPNNKTTSWVGSDVDTRNKLYKESIECNDLFWSRIAREDFYWHQYWTDDAHVKSFNVNKSAGPIFVKWFEGAKTNVCYNALDRHLPEHANRVCFYAEGNLPGQCKQITYGEMYNEVISMANILKSQYNVSKGDRVCMYLPMIPFAAVVMLACARIGAVVSVIFGGYSAQALMMRLEDAKPKVLVTVNASSRADKPLLLKEIADEALERCADDGVNDIKCLVYENRDRSHCTMKDGRDVWYSDALCRLTQEQRTSCEVVWMDAEDPLFMLYTSGSTGKPKALLHTTAGYMVYAATTFKYTFDYHLSDVYFCTADIGWITGHSYVVYGPMIHCATSVLFEGVPTFPSPSRWWELVQEYKVTIFYTAPTAIRSLMKFGNAPVEKCDRSSLRILGSVGEPINVEAWMWFYEVVGDRHVDIVDTWWQTETGGHMITPLPGCTPLKPGSATFPFFGIEPAILDPVKLCELNGAAEGLLTIRAPWPGLARTIVGDHARYEATYFTSDGHYLTGDGARRDKDGYLWITGRVDDVLNVSGHRIGTSEIEDAINSHPAVVESAAVGIPHDVKGESIYAFVTFHCDTDITPDLLKLIRLTVRKVIGPFASPDHIQPAQCGLPKTRSGKIVRRILRKIASDTHDDLGDVSTLADPSVIQGLIHSHDEWASLNHPEKASNNTFG